MYCIECGTQIPDDSKFCQHCGKPQFQEGITVNSIIVEESSSANNVTSKNEEQSKIFTQLRRYLGWYLAWVLLHLAILLIFSSSIFDGGSGFWPFSGLARCEYCKFAAYYDITEFLFYTIFPLGVLIVMSLVSDDSSTENNLKSLNK